MPINFANNTLKEYLNQLSSRQPVPGGGSAAALCAAMGVGLLAMVTEYSIGRKSNTAVTNKQLEKVLAQLNPMHQRLLALTSLDAEAYLGVSQAKTLDTKAKRKASLFAKQVPQEVCQLCFKAIKLAPLLVNKGNPYLLSDVEVAIELLMAGFNGARVMVRINS